MKQFELNLEYDKTAVVHDRLCLIYKFSTSEKVPLKEAEKKAKQIFNNKYLHIFCSGTKQLCVAFDTDKWFEDAGTIVDTENRFVKRLQLKRIPNVILTRANANDYTTNIERRFRIYLKDSRPLREKIFKALGNMNYPIPYLKFKYDGNLNCLNIEVKEQFRQSALVNFITKHTQKPVKKTDFDSSVETYLKAIKNEKRR